jgi:O-antigen biosynthesis protein
MTEPSLWDVRRIPRGLRFLRRCGLHATLRRLFPSLRTYRSWVAEYDRLSRADRAAIAAAIGGMTSRPLISLVMPVARCEKRLLRRAVASVEAQLYPNWQLCIAADAPAGSLPPDGRIKLLAAAPGAGLAALGNAGLAAATGDFVAWLRPQDALAAHALYAVAAEIAEQPQAVLVYSDEDAIDRRGRRRTPHFKSDWNPDLMLGCDAIGRLAAWRRDRIVRIGGLRDGFNGAEDYDLALRALEREPLEAIRHIPLVLYHRGDTEDGAATQPARRLAVAEHLARTGAAAEALPAPPGYTRVRYALPQPPPVSLIVPTRDRVELLRDCIDGLLDKTDYPSVEILIVDNDSREPETRDYLAAIAARPNVRVLPYPGPFNYAAINNFAVRQARHAVIGLVNNDIAVIDGGWLREMVSHAVRPEIGAVGAKLYYPDGTIQHAGTIVGLGGGADHAFRHFPRDATGYCGRLVLTQSLSAVTAACMLLRKSVYEAVGGLDAEHLAVAFNDVDLCLRIRDKGYRVVWTPFAELVHRESASRGSDLAPETIGRFRREVDYLKRRWSAAIARDPYYNPNLTIDAPDFGLAFPPRGAPAWRRSTAGDTRPMPAARRDCETPVAGAAVR